MKCLSFWRQKLEVKKGAEIAKPHFNLRVSLENLEQESYFQILFLREENSSTFEGAIEFYFILGHKTASPVHPTVRR